MQAHLQAIMDEACRGKNSETRTPGTFVVMERNGPRGHITACLLVEIKVGFDKIDDFLRINRAMRLIAEVLRVSLVELFHGLE